MKTVLITGANRGLGLEFVKQYHEEGWKVLACCRAPEQAEELKKISDKHLKVYRLDVNSQRDLEALIKELQVESIDLLLNNAGIYGPSGNQLGSLDVASWLKVLATNTIAPLKLVEALIEQVAASQLKRVVFISSIMGSITKNAEGGHYLYRSSKAALNSAVKSLAIDVHHRGITAVAIHPGWVQTDMGGLNAPLTATASVTAIRKLLSSLSLVDSGKFFSYTGEELPW